jgi:hypothetical protein
MRHAIVISLAFGLSASSAPVSAADINLSGDWTANVNAGDLIAGAGTDFRSPIESDSYQTTIDITNTGGAPWMLSVQRMISTLPAGVTLAVRRTTGGSGGGAISGGEGYLTLSSSEQQLFYGSGDRTGIGLQFRVDGVSIQQGVGSFGANLTYRVQ